MLKTLPVQGVKMPEHFSALYNATYFVKAFSQKISLHSSKSLIL